MTDSVTAPSRRALLQTLAIIPAAASALPIAAPWREALPPLHRQYADEPVTPSRSKENRSMSRFRYQQAERYLLTMEAWVVARPHRPAEALHQAGFIAQQALCAHLLDIGFTDAWNARYIKQDIAKALAYANATGLALDCPDIARLAVVLTPYWKWGYHYDRWEKQPDRGGFTADRISSLMRVLLECVHDVTGHPRPKDWRRYQRELRS
jgi:hypothetical protein